MKVKVKYNLAFDTITHNIDKVYKLFIHMTVFIPYKGIFRNYIKEEHIYEDLMRTSHLSTFKLGLNDLRKELTPEKLELKVRDAVKKHYGIVDDVLLSEVENFIDHYGISEFTIEIGEAK